MPRRRAKSFEEAFELRTIKSEKCWEWTGAKNSRGYAQMRQGGVGVYVHIWNYERTIGLVPAGMVLDHFICDNKGCVNPYHVHPETNARNIARTYDGACRNGHPRTSENTYHRPDTGSRACRDCARERKRAA